MKIEHTEKLKKHMTRLPGENNTPHYNSAECFDKYNIKYKTL